PRIHRAFSARFFLPLASFCQPCYGKDYPKVSGALKALISTHKRTERVFLIGLELKSHSAWETRESLDELRELAVSAGAEVLGDGTQKLESPVSSTFIGS